MGKLMILGLCTLVACTARTTEDGVDVDPITDRIGDWSATLQPVNNSGVRGATSARSAATQTASSISIAGARSGGQHPWHIHRGSCGENGPIVGAAAAYPVLMVGANGTATASATVSVGLTEDATYSVNVHRSPTDLGTILACGALND
ncbi:MAG: hypothetical protein ACT4O1_16455 [Gemmatimonadota bacterium]